METTTPPSFIPKDTVQAGSVRKAAKNGLLDLAALASVVLFVVSGVLGVGVLLYDQYLHASAASKIEQLGRASAAFEPALIQELTRLDDRMLVANEVLGKHIAPSAFFRMLEQTTISNISFISLDFDGSDPQHMTIQMDGIADSVNSIALQADLFSKVGMVTSPIFSNINRQTDGVHFSLSALLNPSAINYLAIVRGATQSLPQELTNPTSEVQSSLSPFNGVPEENTASEGSQPTE
ncbi:hypothetical protein C4556_02370 [Candidatus Parcubacteria bacterium]|nr:MAG: hypothetical protein C4556_02370 [Candidatus Parcubacteria bacterium]